ncbi:MAG: Extradiol ring-cleavage dioxygenase class protein subunit [Sphingomonadales bacterium]|jgi:hypothetical protein|nr:Extradiol ring-cleavage dioxygenase class protein subunit [Sphingomonadales bacterium]
MGEILGLGISHYPPLSGNDADMANILKGRLLDPDVPATAKDLSNWPAAMRAEWGEDEGRSSAAAHRKSMLQGVQRVREALDAFNPDFVIIWGDDQYENFKETIIPPFCVMAYEDRVIQPWAQAGHSAMFSDDGDESGSGGRPNVWGEGKDFSLNVRGQRAAASHIASELIRRDFDVSYAYEPLHHPGLPHAFLNSILYLDYDRKGFDYPVVPFQINCYGKLVVSQKGFVSLFGDQPEMFDPPSPSPSRVFDLGAEVARICLESPWRVALVASASWSHAFLVDKTWRMQPDVALDRELYEALKAGDFDRWRQTSLDEIEQSGQQEMLNWFALMGAMQAANQRCVWSEFVETYIFNSSKVAAIFGT